MQKTFTLLILIVVVVSRTFTQEADKDSSETPRFIIEEVVVTADRMENKIANTTASVSLLRSRDVQSLPLGKFSDAFFTIPGFFVVNRDGLGRDPIISTRGFYGGGEAEYLQVLVDGKKLNDVETGLVNWNAVPVNSFDAVEIIRGASSPLYGDAALGGIINIITRKNNTTDRFLSLSGGNNGVFNAQVRSRGVVGDNAYQVYGSSETMKGFREHSNWREFSLGGDVLFPVSEFSSFRILTSNQVTRFGEPGPLTEQEAAQNRNASSAYYKHDGRDETRSQGSIEFNHSFSPSSSFETSVSYAFKKSDRIRTFTNPPVIIDPETYQIIGYDTTQYGDTKQRDLKTNEIGLTLKYHLSTVSGAMRNRLTVGFDGTIGLMRNNYYRYFSGFEEDYKRNTPSRDTAVVDGSGSRAKFAMYLNDELRVEPFTLTMGVRFDAIHDKYEGILPQLDIRAKHLALSPKLGINYRYVTTQSYTGNVYANVNRSFKAATLDQLFDQRSIDAGIFIPTGPGSYFFTSQSFPSFSNPLLKPQTGMSYEIGTYQRFSISQNLYGELTAAYYQIDMKDEIDFDLVTLSYQNLNNTQHRGIESGAKLYLLPGCTMFLNHTWTSVKFSGGSYNGKFLKGIPKNVSSLGASYQFSFGLLTSAMWNFVSDTYLDDDNTQTLTSYNTGSLRCSYSYSLVTVFVDVYNVMNHQYSSTGYLLNGTTYLYPAAGRTIQGGINVSF